MPNTVNASNGAQIRQRHALLAVNVHELQLKIAVSLLVRRLKEEREGVSCVLCLIQ
jgi:hypothetical protein